MTTSENLHPVFNTSIPIEATQSLLIHIKGDESKKLLDSRISISFTISEDGLAITQAYGSIPSRVTSNDKEYPLEDDVTFLYYNKENKISAILAKELTKSMAENKINEAEKSLSLIGDEYVINLYRLIAYHWCALTSGYRLLDAFTTSETDELKLELEGLIEQIESDEEDEDDDEE